MKSNEEVPNVRMTYFSERLFWCCYCSLVLLSSLIGNTLVLVASIRYRAFRLHRVLVLLMEQIAVCDLVSTIVYVLPMAVSLVADGWVMGDVVGYVMSYIQYVSYPAGVLFMAALTTSKVLILWYPTEANKLLKKISLYIVGAIWLASLYFPVAFLIIDKDNFYFDYKIYSPLYNITSDSWDLLKPAGLSLLSVIPNLLVILSTIATLAVLARSRKYAQKSGGSVRWQGVMAVLMTAIVFCASTLPYTAYTLLISPFVHEDPPGIFTKYWKRYAAFLSLLNLMANPYIYACTVNSYRTFLRTGVRIFLKRSRSSLRSFRRRTSEEFITFEGGSELKNIKPDLETKIPRTENCDF